MHWVRRPGYFHAAGDGSDELAGFVGSSLAYAVPQSPQGDRATDPGAASATSPVQQSTNGELARVHDVVFIDSRVPDIQDLLNGLKPGEKAFVIDGSSNGLDQIAGILKAGHLGNLTGIQIVSHGASGALELGSTTLNDSDLSNHAAALAGIGAALTSGGNLSLYACDVAAGATGQQFIADLSHLAGGVEVAAATHDIGLTASGENWTLDASTASSPAPVDVPFTAAAQAHFQGTLSAATAQIWLVATFGGDANELTKADDTGSGVASNFLKFFDPVTHNPSDTTTPTIQNLDLVAFDTARDLVFFSSSDAAGPPGHEYIYSASISAIANGNGGITPTLTPIYQSTAKDVISTIVADPASQQVFFTEKHSLYRVSESGGTPVMLGTISVGFADSMALDLPAHVAYFTSSRTFSTSHSGVPATTVLSNAIYKTTPNVTATAGANTVTITKLVDINSATFGIVGRFDIQNIAVDPATGKVYFTTVGASATNAGGVFEMDPDGTVHTIWTQAHSGLGAGPSGPNGLITSIAVDSATGKYYISVVDSNPGSNTGNHAIYVGNLSDTNNHAPTLFEQLAPYPTGVGSNTQQTQPQGMAIDNAPALSVTSASPTYTETAGKPSPDATPVTLISGTTLSDSDNALLASASVSITSGFDNGVDTLSINGSATGTVGGTSISFSYNAASGVMSLTGVDTLANYQTALAAVKFVASGDNPTNYGTDTSRTLTYKVSDGLLDNTADGSIAAPTVTVAVVGVNDAPALNNAGNTITYVEQAAAGAVDSSITVADPDNLGQAHATVTISSGLLAGDTLHFTNNPATMGNIAFTSFTGGVLTLTSAGGTATLAQWNAALQSVTFDNTTNDDPTAGGDTSRTITWVINDGALDSASVTTTINVTAVNDAPTLTATASSPTFTEAAGVGTQAAAVGMFSGAAANTIESGQTITGLTFTVSGLVDGANENVVVDGTEFALTNGGSGTTATNGLTYAVTVAAGTATVVLSKVAGISAANAAAVVNSIAYQDTSTDNPTAGDRVFTLTQIKDSGGTSSGGVDTTNPAIASTVHVVAVNDPPVNTVPGAQTVNEDTSLAFTGVKLISVADPDNASVTVALSATHGNITLGTTSGLTVTGTNGSHAVTIAGTVAALNTALASLSYKGDSNFNGTDTLTIDTSDGVAPHVISTVGLTVSPVNDAPTVVNGTTATLVAINEDAANPVGAQVVTVIGGHFSDASDEQTANGGTGPDNFAGIAVTANAATASQGTWQYFSGTWQDIATSLPVTSALLLASTASIRFLPAANFNGTPGGLTVHVVDDSGGAITTGATADLTTTGGTTPYSSGTVTIGESVNAVNDAPVFSGLDNTPTFTEGGTAVVLDGNATVADVELAALSSGNGNYSGATLTLARDNGASAQDVFGTSGTLAFSGANVQISGTTVGTFTNTGGKLAITFNASATSAAVNSVLDQITYSNSSNAPSSPVQIDYTFSDGNSGSQGPGGALAANGSISVAITPSNDAPDLTPNSPPAVTYVEGQSSPVALLSTGAVTDPDNPANFSAGSFTVAIGSAQAGDKIVLLGSSPFIDNAGALMDGATAIGTVTGLGSSSVSVTLDSGATPTEVDRLTEAFGFQTNSASTADRTVTFTFKDGGNTGGTAPGLSDSVSQTVHVTQPPDGQLFFRINQSNDVQLGAINDTGPSATPQSIYFGGGIRAGTPQNIGVHNGNETSIAVDTAAGLVFSVGIGNQGSYDAISVHNLKTGALIETIEFGPNTGGANTDDIVMALTLDPFTNTLYVGDWGTTLGTTGVAEFTYNPATGLLSPSTTGHSATSITTTIAGGSSTTTTANGIYLFDATQVPQFTNANAFYLDAAHNKLYFTNDDFGYHTSPFGPTNAVYVTDTTTLATTQLTSLTQFPAADQNLTGHDHNIGANGSVLGLAVDVADGIVFFETTDTPGSTNNALWWVNTTGADQTATKITLPPGVTLNFAGQISAGGDAAGLTFDASTKQLYLTNANNDVTVRDTGAIYQLQYDPATHSVTLVNTYDAAQLIGATPATVDSLSAPSTTTFDSLPVLGGVTGTATHATEQGAAVNLLTGAPTITDSDGNHLASATLQITGGTFSSNENSTADDHLSINGQISGQISGTNITVTWTAASETLTLSGYDTLANYETVLGEVQYNTTGNNPTNYGIDTTRTIAWQVNDGAIGNPVASNTGTSTIAIDAVNDAPANAAPASTLTVNEDTSLAFTAGNTISVSDPDNQSLTVTLTAANGTVTLGSATNLTVTGTNGSGSVAISGTIADINAALATLSYKGNANYFGPDTVTVDSFDGVAHTQSTVNITVNAVNDAPVLDLDANDSSGAVNADYQATFTVGGSGVAIADTDTSITDDNTTLAFATITLTNHQANDLLSVNGTLPASIAASSYNSATGVLTLTGTGATLADFQTALHQVTFSNSSVTAALTDRVVTVVVDDGQGGANHASNVATATIHLGTQTVPFVTSVAATTVGNVTDLDAGQVVTIAVNFSASVNVTGAPTLQLNDSELASYVSGSGSTALVFSYTVQPGDNVADLQVQSLLLNGGTIKDSTGNDALINAATDLHLQVDTTAPTVTSVSVPANTTYIVGQNLDFVANFSEAVTVTGTPEIAVTLDTGGIVEAQYLSGSGTSALTFRYTLVSGEADSDGVAVGSAIALHGGTIQDGATNDAVLNLNNVASTVGVLVDAIPPTTTSLTAVTDNGHTDIGAGHVITITLDTSEPVTVVGTPTLSLNDLGSATYTGGSGTSVLTFSYTVPAGDNIADLQVTGYGGSIHDPAGNALAPVTADLGIQIDTTAPTVTVAADHTALLAGQTAAMTFTFSEAIQSFVLGDTTVTGGALSNLVHAGLVAGQDVYTATFTPDVTNTEVGSVQVNGSSYSDGADNAGAASNTVNFTGDTLAPTTTTVTATTNDGHTDINVGHVVTITVNTSEAVTVTGTPTLNLNDGEVATYIAGSGTTTLTFGNTVVAGDNTPDLKVTGYGGTIQDTGGNPLPAFTGDLGIQVDTIAPHLNGITASPASGSVFAGSTVEFVFAFNEAVNVTGGTPQLSLSDGRFIDYSPTATAALHDPTKLAFDYLVSSSDPMTSSLAVTSFVSNGATVKDLAGNAATLNNVAATFPLQVNESSVPAFTVGGITRPALTLDSAGDIVLDATSAAFAEAYGTKFLYLGLPANTPYPPVDPHHDFHIV